MELRVPCLVVRLRVHWPSVDLRVPCLVVDLRVHWPSVDLRVPCLVATIVAQPRQPTRG
jgi:hypothetical protein